MYKSIIVVATILTTALAFPQACLKITNQQTGELCADYQSTKECCASVPEADGYTFREIDNTCNSPSGDGGSFAPGTLAECCESKGMSHRDYPGVGIHPKCGGQ